MQATLMRSLIYRIAKEIQRESKDTRLVDCILLLNRRCVATNDPRRMGGEGAGTWSLSLKGKGDFSCLLLLCQLTYIQTQCHVIFTPVLPGGFYYHHYHLPDLKDGETRAWRVGQKHIQQHR